MATVEELDKKWFASPETFEECLQESMRKLAELVKKEKSMDLEVAVLNEFSEGSQQANSTVDM